jgi:hypothetical protein
MHCKWSGNSFLFAFSSPVHLSLGKSVPFWVLQLEFCNFHSFRFCAIIYFEYILVLEVAKPNCSFTQFERSLIIITNITIVISLAVFFTTCTEVVSRHVIKRNPYLHNKQTIYSYLIITYFATYLSVYRGPASYRMGGLSR